MDKDINNQIEYIKKRVKSLVDLCEKDTSIEVSGEVRNITQDILTNLNRLLDIVMYYFYDSKIKPNIAEEQKNKYDKNVYFPVCTKPENIKGCLGSFGALDLEKDHPVIFNLISNIQPYNSNEWIKQLRDYSNLGHRKLISQKKKHETYITLQDTVKINDKVRATFNNCSFNGVPVKNLTVDRGIISGDLDPRLNPKIETEIIYLLEDSNINVIFLCQKALLEIEKLFKGFNAYLNR